MSKFYDWSVLLIILFVPLTLYYPKIGITCWILYCFYLRLVGNGLILTASNFARYLYQNGKNAPEITEIAMGDYAKKRK